MFWQVIRNIPENVFPSSKYIERQLHAGHPTKLLTVDDAIQLIMVLPGQTAMEVRIQFAVIIRNFFKGDQTLHAEINANAVSNAPICQLARASVNASPEPVQDTLSLTRKRQLEREDALFEMEMAERKERLLRMSTETQRMSTETKVKMAEAQVKLERDLNLTIHERMEMYKSLCPYKEIDDRAKIMFKDTLMNITSQSAFTVSAGSQLAIGNGFEPSFKSISISSVADDLKLKFEEGDWQKIGLELSNRYKALHGDRPPKHSQLVGGKPCDVCDYYEPDRPLMEEVCRWYAEKKESERNGEQGKKGKKGKKGGKKSEDKGQKKIQSFMSSRQQMGV